MTATQDRSPLFGKPVDRHNAAPGFGAWLRRVRVEYLQLTQEQLADELQVNHFTISRWERDDPGPNYWRIHALAMFALVVSNRGPEEWERFFTEIDDGWTEDDDDGIR